MRHYLRVTSPTMTLGEMESCLGRRSDPQGFSVGDRGAAGRVLTFSCWRFDLGVVSEEEGGDGLDGAIRRLDSGLVRRLRSLAVSGATVALTVAQDLDVDPRGLWLGPEAVQVLSLMGAGMDVDQF